MNYEELYRRYGTHVTQRIRRELTTSEFDTVNIDDLPHWLELRAEKAHTRYLHMLSNPISSSEKNPASTGEACRRWREAEDLAYLVVIAEDVGAHARAV